MRRFATGGRNGLEEILPENPGGGDRTYFRRDTKSRRTATALALRRSAGSQLSEHARSALLGIGYPTILNGFSTLCILPRQSHEIEELDKLTAHYEHVPNSVGRHWTGNDPNHKALVCVE